MTNRRNTNTVYIGNLPLGIAYPIRLQSMTNTNALDTQASVQQAMRIFDAGADYVRLTTQGIKEAQNLEKIKSSLIQKGYNKPLIADVHFNPKVAELAATIVEKVRINPGNYTDKKKFEILELNEKEYEAEIGKIKERFLPLIEICKKHNTAIRIGVNHGSLSDRIINKYGDTPEGMAEAAMEFLKICKDADFDQVVLSMKASNPKIMVYSNRLIVQKMATEGMAFPIHLGVTEAGEGEDGRIKSAAGIGTLLAEGIGDTIRVSLTEDPEMEIPVAKTLVGSIFYDSINKDYKTISFQRRKTTTVKNIGGDNVPVVILNVGTESEFPEKADYLFAPASEDLKLGDKNIKWITPLNVWFKNASREEAVYPVMASDEYLKNTNLSPTLNFVNIDNTNISESLTAKLKGDPAVVLVLEGNTNDGFGALLKDLLKHQLPHPFILKGVYDGTDIEQIIIKSSAQLGAPFFDGIGDGLWLEAQGAYTLNIGFGILQAVGARITKTEYISCPTCGRTSFNITQTLREIKEKTSHLKGLKIAVMGCIVNGPGEMADADYGFIGAGKGKVTLYKGKTPVLKNIDEKDAVAELLKIIDNKLN